jgi:hypothetical protein
MNQPILEITKIKSFLEAFAIRKLSFLTQFAPHSLTINNELEHGVVELIKKCGYTNEYGYRRHVIESPKNNLLMLKRNVIEYLLRPQTFSHKRLFHFIQSAKHFY